MWLAMSDEPAIPKDEPAQEEVASTPWSEAKETVPPVAHTHRTMPPWQKTVVGAFFATVAVGLIASACYILAVQISPAPPLESLVSTRLGARQRVGAESTYEAEPPQVRYLDGRLSLAMAQTEQLRQTSKSLKKRLDEVDAMQTRCDQLIAQLLTDEQGRRIASDPDEVKLFEAVRQRSPEIAEQSAGVRVAIGAFTAEIERTRGDSESYYEADESVFKQLAAWEDEIASAKKTVADSLALIESIERSTSANDASESTLEDAISRLEAARSRRRAEEVAKLVDASESKLVEELAASRVRLMELADRKQLAQEEIEATNRLGEIADAEALKKLIEDEIERGKERAALEREFRAALLEIQGTLIPFISPGHQQLNGKEWVYVDAEQPMSLSGIRAWGALDNDAGGYMHLYVIAGSGRNDRPHGPFGSYTGGAVRQNEVPTVRRAQALLEKFGDLMVQKNMLAP